MKIKVERFLGVYENVIYSRHDVSHVFIAKIVAGKIKRDFQSSNVKFFKKLPAHTVPYQRKMIRDARVYLR